MEPRSAGGQASFDMKGAALSEVQNTSMYKKIRGVKLTFCQGIRTVLLHNDKVGGQFRKLAK